MPSIGHAMVGLAGGRLQAGDGPRLRPTLVLTALATFPDLDVLLWPYRAGAGIPWSHRGASHSLAVAAVAAAVGALLLDRRRGGYPAAFLVALAAAASHGLLDTVTHGGAGVMLLWPFSRARFLAPWHLLPASPMGPRLLHLHGLEVMAKELLLFSPLLVYALWPRRRQGHRTSDSPRGPSTTSSPARNGGGLR
jgi:inner membrane protein